MIEFSGYLYGSAEKRFWKKERALTRMVLFLGILLVLPWILFYGIKSQNWKLIVTCIAGVIVIELLTFIPQREKEKKKLIPKKITIDDDLFIICKADKYVETKSISDVKAVVDCGEYYELVFPFGKVSNRFICQKSLITKGSIEEFELLFDGKMKKRQKNT